jgi:DNA-binding transcriptional regulator YiaG
MLIAQSNGGFTIGDMGKPVKKRRSKAQRAQFPEMGERMTRIRMSTGKEPRAFATWVGIEYTTWHNYEQGYSIPWYKALLLIKKMPWLSASYIYEGAASDPETARKLGIFDTDEGDAGE